MADVVLCDQAGQDHGEGQDAHLVPLSPIGKPADEHLRLQLRRLNMQVWRCELYMTALTSAAARRWRVTPPPQAQRTVAVQQASIRQQLRVLAVMCRCLRPFQCWWRVCHHQRATRLGLLRSEAAAAMRTARTRDHLLREAVVRMQKQDATLRKLGQSTRTRGAVRRWAHLSRLGATLRQGGLMLRWHWLLRWRRTAAASRAHGPPTRRAQRLRALAAALCAMRASASGRASARRLRVRLRLRVALRTWSRRRLAAAGGDAAMAVASRALRWRTLLRAVRAWQRVALSRLRRHLSAHQDAAITALLRLWCNSAYDAVDALATLPAGEEETTLRRLCALGGSWPGGRVALEAAVGELSRYKTLVLRERQEVGLARRTSEAAAARVEEIFQSIRQQQANVDALSSAVARASTEVVCLQASLVQASTRYDQLVHLPEVAPPPPQSGGGGAGHDDDAGASPAAVPGRAAPDTITSPMATQSARARIRSHRLPRLNEACASNRRASPSPKWWVRARAS